MPGAEQWPTLLPMYVVVFKKNSLLKKCTTPKLSTNPSNCKSCNHLKTACSEKQTKIQVSKSRISFAQTTKHDHGRIMLSKPFYKAVTNNILN